MRPLTHIGEATAEIGGKVYLVRPSFRALSTIDDLEDEIGAVCAAYNLLLSEVTPTVWQLCSCANVLRSCSDMPPEWFGELVDRAGKWKYKFNKLSMRELVIMAHHCIKWGVYGSDKYFIKPTKKDKQQERRPFDPADFVSVLIEDFKLPLNDAWNATMTEFQQLCDARNRRYWQQKGTEPITRERAEAASKYAHDAIRRANELGLKGKVMSQGKGRT